MLGLSEAARLVGRDVSTLHRAMKSGRLAYTMGADGKRRLDPAELERVFEIKSVIPGGNGLGDDEGNAAPVRAAMRRSELQSSNAAEKEEIIIALRDSIARQDATIADLRARLDAAAEGRRAERQQEADERRRLLAILTDQSRRRWWRRWFR